MKNLEKLQNYLPKSQSTPDLMKIAQDLLQKYRKQIAPVPRLNLDQTSHTERFVKYMMEIKATNKIRKHYGLD